MQNLDNEQAAAAYDKPKRHLEEDLSAYTVTDDGELVEIDEDAGRNTARR